MKNLIVDGLSISYRDVGTGPVTLFLHGWGTSSASFESLIHEYDTQNRRVIAVDAPGFGKSELPPVAWSVGDYAAFVRHFLDKLDVTQPEIIVGHSFGGRIAIKGVAEGIFKPRQLVLIASAGMASPGLRQRFFSFLLRGAKPFGALPPFSFIKNSLQKKLRSSDYARAGALKATFLKVVKENLRNDAEKINLPTLLIWGVNDTETPLTEARLLHEAIKNSKLEVIAGEGHFIHQEAPLKVVGVMNAFTSHA